MSFRSELLDDGKKLSIYVEGKFDFKMRSQFIALYDAHLETVDALSIDLSQVNYIDSAACGGLIVLHKRAAAANVSIESILINSEVKKIVDVLNLSLLFDFTLVEGDQ